ncbi:solute carrier family 22 member 23-like isoform X2 [Anguilla anguilla]|uniref:solute carrier family 22 member 23-like isoform X2 n=1 Tax=Anguilla anguilla TaxID=7936 RepID=UPI0015B0BCC9|nr:solute carrier family 22 member 23-like isoform X2 [Anguilla anguilla]
MAVVRLETGDHQPENGFVSSETTSTGLLSRIDGSVLPFLGGFGKYQKQLIVLTCIPVLFLGFSQFSDNFLLAQPNSTCIYPNAKIGNNTGSSVSLLRDSNSSTTAPRLHANGTGNESASIDCSCLEWNYRLQTGLVQNVVTKWNLVCNSEWKVHIAKFSLLVGSIFGYLVLGVLADWFGRRPVLITSVLFMVVFGLTVAFSVNVPMFSTLRFFEGFCLAGITLSLYVLRIELCLPLWRFRVTMVANFVVLAAQLLMPGLAALCRDWQILQAVIICPFILMLSYIWVFPESLRWLLSTQQYCRARRQMHRIARKNKVGGTDTDELFSELQNESQKKPKKTCIVKMVGTRNLWKNIVVLCVNSLTGYGIHHCFARSMIDPEAGKTSVFHNFYADYYTMAGIAVASCMALCPAVGFMGRRGGLLMFMIITALASLLQLGLLTLLGKYSFKLNIEQEQSDTLNKKFSIAFSIIGMFSSHAVSNLSIFFCAEITPTVIRGGGLGLVLASAGFGMLTAPIMELHNQKGYFLHHVIFACCTLICIICILLLPETRYKPLPEHIGDGEACVRPPLLAPKKAGEQDPLLHQAEPGERARVQETALRGTDEPRAVEDVSVCVVGTPPPGTAVAPPPCVVEVTPVRSTGAPPPCKVDAVGPVAVENELPKIAGANPPIAKDNTPPSTADITPPSPPSTTDTTPPSLPCTTDTTPSTPPSPPCATDATSPDTTDPKSPDSTDQKSLDTTDPKSPSATDPKSPSATDPKSPSATDSKSPNATDPISPSATDHKSPSATDPKSPSGTDFKSPSATDPKSPSATDPKSPKATDPKSPSATDPKSPKATDLKSPSATDPKSPKATDPKSPSATDPKSPSATEPKSPSAKDPKSPSATDPKSPKATDSKAPSATDPKSPSATDPKSPKATDPKSPSAKDFVSPRATDAVLLGATDAPATCVIDAVNSAPTDPATPPANGTATANATPPSLSPGSAPNGGTEGAIPLNGAANGVRSS